jgi:hypothetical protein
MRTDPHSFEVRQLVLDIFQRLGVDIQHPSEMEETILIEEGKYAARSYRVDGYWAIWLLSGGVVQFYDEDGNMIQTVNLFEELEPEQVRLAA